MTTRAWSDAYVIAVASGWEFWLHDRDWMRLSAYDDVIARPRLREALARLDALGAVPPFGAVGARPVPAAAAVAVAALRAQLEAIRAAAPEVFADPSDLATRILCTDDRPCVHTVDVLLGGVDEGDVHVLAANDQPDDGAWLRRGELARFRHLRYVVLSGNRLGATPLGIDLGALPELRALDLQENGLRAIPPEVLACRDLEALHLRDNALGADAAAALSTMHALRYVDLRDNPIDAAGAARLARDLPGCLVET